MDTHTITHGDYAITVDELTWGGARRAKAIIKKLVTFLPDFDTDDQMLDLQAYEVLLDNDMYFWGMAIGQSSNPKGFTLPLAQDTPEAIYASFQACEALPASFMQEWFDTARRYRQPVSAEIAPPEVVTEAVKKNSKTDA